TGGEVDQAGADAKPAGVQFVGGCEAGWLLAERPDTAVGNEDIGHRVEAAGRIEHPAAANDQSAHAASPVACMANDITAMRTAMPFVTCGRITERGPSATAESISTPRLIGPGCMTMASGLASASLSSVRP